MHLDRLFTPRQEDGKIRVRRAAEDHNYIAETLMEFGNALRWAMADLLRRDKKTE